MNKINFKYILLTSMMLVGALSAFATVNAYSTGNQTPATNTISFSESSTIDGSEQILTSVTTASWTWWTGDTDKDGFEDTLFVENYINYNFNSTSYIELYIDLYWLGNGSDFVYLGNNSLYEYRGNLNGVGAFSSFMEFRVPNGYEGNFQINRTVYENGVNISPDFFNIYGMKSYDPLYVRPDFVSGSMSNSTWDQDIDGLADTVGIWIDIEYQQAADFTVEALVEVYVFDNVTASYVLTDTISEFRNILSGEGWVFFYFEWIGVTEGDYLFKSSYSVDSQAPITFDPFYVNSLSTFNEYYWWSAGSYSWDQDGDGGYDTVEFWIDFDYYLNTTLIADVYIDLLYWDGLSWSVVDTAFYGLTLLGNDYQGNQLNFIMQNDGNYTLDLTVIITDSFALVIETSSLQWYYVFMTALNPFINVWVDFYTWDADFDGWDDSFDIYVNFNSYLTLSQWFNLNIDILVNESTGWTLLEQLSTSELLGGLSASSLNLMWQSTVNGDLRVDVYLESIGEVNFTDTQTYYWYNVESFGNSDASLTYNLNTINEFDGDSDGWVDSLEMSLDFFWNAPSDLSQYFTIIIDIFYWDGSNWLWEDSLTIQFWLNGGGSYGWIFSLSAPYDGDYFFQISYGSPDPADPSNIIFVEEDLYFWYGVRAIGGYSGDFNIDWQWLTLDQDLDGWDDTLLLRLELFWDSLNTDVDLQLDLEIWLEDKTGSTLLDIIVTPVLLPATTQAGSYMVEIEYNIPNDGNYLFDLFVSENNFGRDLFGSFSFFEAKAYDDTSSSSTHDTTSSRTETTSNGNNTDTVDETSLASASLPVPFSDLTIFVLALFGLVGITRIKRR